MHLIMNLKHNFSHYSNEILDAMYTTDIKKSKKKNNKKQMFMHKPIGFLFQMLLILDWISFSCVNSCPLQTLGTPDL